MWNREICDNGESKGVNYKHIEIELLHSADRLCTVLNRIVLNAKLTNLNVTRLGLYTSIRLWNDSKYPESDGGTRIYRRWMLDIEQTMH